MAMERKKRKTDKKQAELGRKTWAVAHPPLDGTTAGETSVRPEADVAAEHVEDLVEVRREEAADPPRVEPLEQRRRQRRTLNGRGATPDFVEHHQRARRALGGHHVQVVDLLRE